MPRSHPPRPPARALLAGLLVLLASLASATAEASPPAAACRLDLTLPGPLYMMGYSVGTAGDVNGDGFADVIVGAWIGDGAGMLDGKAYVYFGGPAADSLADMTLTGRSRTSQIGPTVATAGDVNGDGYDDIIASASLLSDPWGNLDAGHAHIYLGGASPATTPDLVLSGEAPGDHFGIVSSAGDMNGDGYADVVVGAPFNDAGGLEAGRAYVYFGGAAMDSIADLTLTGAAAGDVFGYAARTAGDVNGDGYDDLVIGAYGSDAGGTNTGRAYIYFGGPSPDATPDLILTGTVAGGMFGASVGTAGDMNGDGYADVLVQSDGAVYVFFGGAGPPTRPPTSSSRRRRPRSSAARWTRPGT